MSSQPNKPISRFAYRNKDPLWKQKQLEKNRFYELYENIKEQSFKAPEDQPKQQTLVLSSQESYLNYTGNDHHKLDFSHRQKIFDTTKTIQPITRILPKPVNIQSIDVQTSFIQHENKNLQTSFREISVANSQINFDKLNQSYLSISIFQESDKEVLFEPINKKSIFQPVVYPIKIISQTRFKPQHHSIDIQTSLLSYNSKNIQTSFQPELLMNDVSYQQSLKQQNQQSELKLSVQMSRQQSIIQYNPKDQSQRLLSRTSNIDELVLKYDYEKWHPQQQLNSNTLSVQGQYTYKFCRICLNHIKDVNLEIHSRFNCEEYRNTYEEMVYKFQYLLQYELNRQFDDQLSRDLCTIGLEILAQLQVCKTQKRKEQLIRDLNNVQNSLLERKSAMTMPICDLFVTIQAYL